MPLPLSQRPGDLLPADYADADSYVKACLIDVNPSGAKKVAELAMLPVYDPDGALNMAAVKTAAAKLFGYGGGVPIDGPRKKQAARTLMRLYQAAGEQPPSMLRSLAR